MYTFFVEKVPKMNSNFQICEARVGDRYGVCAVDTGTLINLVAAEYFFRLVQPISVKLRNGRGVAVLGPQGQTFVTLGSVDLTVKIGERRVEGQFEIVSDPELRHIAMFDLVMNPWKVKNVDTGEPLPNLCDIVQEFKAARGDNEVMTELYGRPASDKLAEPTVKRLKRE